MTKQFALFDFDKTLYNGFSLMDIVQAQIADNILPQSVVDDLQSILDDHDAGKIGYEEMAQSHLTTYATALKGKSYDDVFQTCLQHFKTSNNLFPFAKPVIDLLSDTHETALVTALPEPGAKAAAAVLGVNQVYCTKFGVNNDIFTGEVTESLANKGGKHACVQRIEQEHTMENSFVFGDSEGDAEMLGAATHAICINPSEGLRKLAQDNGWNICTPDDVMPTVRKLLSR